MPRKIGAAWWRSERRSKYALVPGKARCKKLGKALLVALIAGLILWLLWMIWLQRYLVFTREGVSLDFDRSTKLLEDREPTPLQPEETRNIQLIYDHDTDLEQQQGLTAILGWYADTEMLLDGVAPVAQALAPGGAGQCRYAGCQKQIRQLLLLHQPQRRRHLR